MPSYVGLMDGKNIDLDDFENELVDLIADSGYLINVFPVYDRTGFVVSLVEFSRDLSEEPKIIHSCYLYK